MMKAEEKIRQSAQQFLDGGEEILAAFVAQPRGNTQAVAGVGALGRAQKGKEQRAASAAGFRLASPMALAITQRRLLSFEIGAMARGDVKELIASAPLEDVDAIKTRRLLVGKIVTLSVRGQEFKLEVGAGANTKGVVEVFDRAKATSA